MIFRYINTNEVERLGHVVVSHPCKCGLGVPFDCSGFLTTNAPTGTTPAPSRCSPPEGKRPIPSASDASQNRATKHDWQDTRGYIATFPISFIHIFIAEAGLDFLR